MRLKSYSAASLPEAMKLVRDALGADAVILSTQPGENGTGVRVTAALEDSPLDDLHFDDAPAAYFDVDTIAEALSFHRVPAGRDAVGVRHDARRCLIARVGVEELERDDELLALRHRDHDRDRLHPDRNPTRTAGCSNRSEGLHSIRKW